MSDSNTQHPGSYIREHVLPKGLNVTQAAKKLEVGRPALSNMLNGKAALSADMASRIEHAFGASAHRLMDMQAAYEASIAQQKNSTTAPKPYVPPFLQIKANDIEEWAGKHAARSRLSVFLRTLANSTGRKLTKIQFPGNDDSERPGWDGYIEADEANPWIPAGKSGWEFGVNQEPKTKADGDYAKSVDQSTAEERKETTFVFVTPRRWPGKNDWEKSRRNEKKWKDVRVYDASNLEEWLEQSIPGQAWFANETGISSDGVRSLEACWQEWIIDTEPELSPELFAPAIEEVRLSAKKKLSGPPGDPLIISADSTLEAIAFLHCLLLQGGEELSHFKDRAIVFDKPGQLNKLVSKSSHFIAITASRDVEQEMAQHSKYLRSVIVYPRSTANIEADITLEPLAYEPFNKALKGMGCNDDEVSRLTHESGRSLTVLRRRLSNTAAVRTPSWASKNDIAQSLIPFLFAGSWKTKNDADRVIMELLSDQLSYEVLEQRFSALHNYEDSPVWHAGTYCGLVSKIDVLFAISNHITEPDIRRFLNVAKLVLSEDDPSLDLPEDKRWAAGIYGKSRDISSTLRDGICETLVLLAVYGNQLFKKRFDVDWEIEIGNLIEELLTPLTVRTLESHSSDLPMYAEAAPEMFLNILESDLEKDEPSLFGLLQPVSSALFGRCYRSGLLWALENLAWSEKHLSRTILILGKLAQQDIDDNWANKPESTLKAIFRCWMPQTSVDVEKRIEALEFLAKNFPDVAWRICVEQFGGMSRTGHYSHKPRWRTDGHGYGEPVTRGEANKFTLHALDMAIKWGNHDRKTLGDLVQSIRRLDIEDQEKIWSLIEHWSKNASESDKNWLREKIRINAFSRRAVIQRKKGNHTKTDLNKIKEIYDSLIPSDVLLKHEWLFLKGWVDESVDELEEDEMDFRKRDERIAKMRKDALTEILEDRGMQGVVDLAEKSEAASMIGWNVSQIYKNSDELVAAIRFILDLGPLADNSSCRFLIYGALSSLTDDRADKLIPLLIKNIGDAELVPVLTLCPFKNSTWSELEKLNEDIQKAYWKDVPASWSHNTDDELKYAVNKLIEVRRPKTAFNLIRFDVKKIQPKQLLKLMQTLGTNDCETSDAQQLESYAIRDVLEKLNNSSEIPIEDLSALEFKFIDILDTEDSKIPNLEMQIEKHPELYVHAIAFAYKRSDEGEDPQELKAVDDEHKENRAHAAHKLLDKLARIPGRNKDGELNPDDIIEWVTKVRTGCKELARDKICEHVLGKLFSTAPVGDDDIWPIKPVRDALEQILTQDMSDGLKVALYNKRGVHWRGEGGSQERELATEFQQWVNALQYTHPKIAKVLSRLVKGYEREAEWQDEEAIARKRIRKW